VSLTCTIDSVERTPWAASGTTGKHWAGRSVLVPDVKLTVRDVRVKGRPHDTTIIVRRSYLRA